MKKTTLVSFVIVVILYIGITVSCRDLNKHAAVIIDGPWECLPASASPALAFDKEWGALTLKTDLASLVFLLEPDPDKDAFSNKVSSLIAYDGRLYLGYGDIINNRGPVDIVSYDPLGGYLNREMLDISEEAIGGWHIASDGQLYVAGIDARESWEFGNFYFYDGKSWIKRRTIPSVSKVYEVVDFRGRLYSTALHIKPPVNYPFVLVSDDNGITWTYEPVDKPVYKHNIKYASVIFETITHPRSEFLYAKVWVCDKDKYGDCGERAITRLYRFDGNVWQRITITNPLGKFMPQSFYTFQEKILVCGNIYNEETQYRSSAVYALDGKTQSEVAFLKDKPFRGNNCTVYNEWLYWIKHETAYDDPLHAWALYRTTDLEEWEKVGPIELLPGARPLCLGFVHGRLYVGASNTGWWYKRDHVEMFPVNVYPLEDASLKWQAEVPQGAKLALKIRSAKKRAEVYSLPWVGPDGTENSSFTQSGETLSPRHNGDTVFQVAIYKTQNDKGKFPLVKRLTIETIKGSVSLAVDEGQGLYASANMTDPDGVEYLSSIFRLKEPVEGGGFFFEGATPGNTSLRFQVRSAPSMETIKQKSFIGPYGIPNSFYKSSGETLWEGHNGDTYIQYKAILTSSDQTLTPFLHKVAIVTQSDLSFAINFKNTL